MDYTAETDEEILRIIREYGKAHLKEGRFCHTERVAEEAVKLAKRFGADVKKAELCGFLHDIARNLPQNEMDCLVRKAGLDYRYEGNRNLAHSKIAAWMAREDFGIADEEILSAVSYHTTGRKGMSLLEKVIFLADAIELDRDYPGVEEIRQLAETDLDGACIEYLKNIIAFIQSKNEFLDRDTAEALDYFKKEKESMSEEKIKAELIAKTLSDKKGIDVVIIDIAPKASFADYFVVASGGSDRQVAALVEHVEDIMEPQDVFPKSVEGRKSSGWILMDYGDVVVNIMSLEMRERYNIEKVWGDCVITKIN